MGLLIPGTVDAKGNLKIDDGYTFEGEIAAKAPWPKVTFTFRPPSAREALDYYAAEKGSGQAWENAIVSLLAKKVASWDVTEADPVTREELPVPITEANLRRVPEPVLARMVNVVLAAGQESAAKN